MLRPLSILFALLLSACTHPASTSEEGITELQRIDQTIGKGTLATEGSNVTVHYTGWLYNGSAPDRHGKQFDSSLDQGRPFSFPLGAGHVIRGWDEGVAGMRVGGKRILLIPPEYGYGHEGAGTVIPPDASLVFEVELLDVRSH